MTSREHVKVTDEAQTDVAAHRGHQSEGSALM
eukprot:CAMPEP_0174700342 /NCGR_PEP_ID=MMETSP1094-20130205/5320_1 /TAXON_ID=156173 /ORGANISM="Chrysochromulina brevifilum, Strain UTEX LB 985" /LENGTH=31 /DNA_ID= /DNA_START= /DNA_END= /DNA_ORIENTATION=